jgi:hypothetical protein
MGVAIGDCTKDVLSVMGGHLVNGCIGLVGASLGSLSRVAVVVETADQPALAAGDVFRPRAFAPCPARLKTQLV